MLVLASISYGIHCLNKVRGDIKIVYRSFWPAIKMQGKKVVTRLWWNNLPLLNNKTVFFLAVSLLLVCLLLVCYLYWVYPESIHQVLDSAQVWLFENVPMRYRMVVRMCQWFREKVFQTAYCDDSTENKSSGSSSNTSGSPSSKSSSGWPWGSRSDPPSSTKKDDFIGTMASKAKKVSEQCDQDLRQRLDTIDNEPFTPRRDTMRKNHAWEIHKSCKNTMGVYFDIFNQHRQTSYSASYDFKTKKVEVQYKSGK